MRSSKMAARVSACFSPCLLSSSLSAPFSLLTHTPPFTSPLSLPTFLSLPPSQLIPLFGSAAICNLHRRLPSIFPKLAAAGATATSTSTSTTTWSISNCCLSLCCCAAPPLLLVQVTQLALFARAQFHALLSLIVYPWDYGNITMPRATVGDVGRRRLPYPLPLPMFTSTSSSPFTPLRGIVIGCEMLAKLATAGGAKERARGSSRGGAAEGDGQRGNSRGGREGGRLVQFGVSAIERCKCTFNSFSCKCKCCVKQERKRKEIERGGESVRR